MTRLRPPGRVDAPGGLTIVRYAQSAAGIPAYDNGVEVALDRAGRVISLTGSPSPDLEANATSPRLTAAEALQRLRADVGGDGPRTPDRAPADAVHGRHRRGSPGVVAVLPRRARPRTGPRVVDATTGEVLYRANRVKRGSTATSWTPTAARPARAATPDDGQPHAARMAAPERRQPDRPERAHVLRRQRRRHGAVERGGRAVRLAAGLQVRVRRASTASCRTTSATRRCADGTRPSPRVGRRTASRTRCRPSTSTTSSTTTSSRRRSASTRRRGTSRATIRWCSRRWTAPRSTSGLPDTLHLSNANMSTPPDGEAPTMQLYLFARPFFSYLGDDAATVWHEYAHGLSNRLVTNAGGEGALNTAHAGRDGGGVERLVRPRPARAPRPDRRRARHDRGGRPRRAVGRDAPPDAHPGARLPGRPELERPCGRLPRRRGDRHRRLHARGLRGSVAGTAEVHADGEIWARDAVGPAPRADRRRPASDRRWAPTRRRR